MHSAVLPPSLMIFVCLMSPQLRALLKSENPAKGSKAGCPKNRWQKSLINTCFNCLSWESFACWKIDILLSVLSLPKNNQEVCTWGQETKCQARVEDCRLIWSNLKLKIRHENWKWKSAKGACCIWKLSFTHCDDRKLWFHNFWTIQRAKIMSQDIYQTNASNSNFHVSQTYLTNLG